MKILLLYATNSGGTYQAANIISELLIAQSHVVELKNPKDISEKDLLNYDLVIMGSPSWDYEDKEGQPHEDFIDLMTRMNGKRIENTKFAVFGLGDTSYTYYCGAIDHLEKFIASGGGKLVVPSLRIDRFYSNLPEHTKSLTNWVENISNSLS